MNVNYWDPYVYDTSLLDYDADDEWEEDDDLFRESDEELAPNIPPMMENVPMPSIPMTATHPCPMPVMPCGCYQPMLHPMIMGNQPMPYSGMPPANLMATPSSPAMNVSDNIPFMGPMIGSEGLPGYGAPSLVHNLPPQMMRYSSYPF